jgi:hypothetical protein
VLKVPEPGSYARRGRETCCLTVPDLAAREVIEPESSSAVESRSSRGAPMWTNDGLPHTAGATADNGADDLRHGTFSTVRSGCVAGSSKT